ncbi:hypothetical protein VKT23_018198 [Stygiomarasmius scandens]|uniref:Uncharacterized protein n=1 Tax=Marasmiellus scandens TaxID=2682957 RepID=A0ABR1ISL6_9AGAR
MIKEPPTHLPAPKPDSRATRRPKSKSRIAYYLWRANMWIEGTFVLHMLEPWEKLLLVFISFILFSLLVTGIVRYLPHHISVMQRRTIYYIWGNTSTAVSSGDDRAFLTLVNELASETLKTEL